MAYISKKAEAELAGAPAGMCQFTGCYSPAMPAEDARRRLAPMNVPTGLCKAHTLGAVMALKAGNLPEVTREYTDAGPYREWVTAALASGTLTFKGLTLHDVTQKDLAAIIGVHRVMLSRLVNGHQTSGKIRRSVVNRMRPFILYVSTAPNGP